MAGVKNLKRCSRRFKKATKRVIEPSRFAWTGATTDRTATLQKTLRSSRNAGSGCPTTCLWVLMQTVVIPYLQGRRLEEMGVAHFEEPLPQYDFPGLPQVVDALDCTVSTGEQEISAWRFRDLLTLGNPDILQPDILNVGGLSEVVRVYELAAINNKFVMPHSPGLGANSLASLHAYSKVTNATRPHEFSEEFTGPVDYVASLFVYPIIPKNGTIRLTNRPSLGIELDEIALTNAIAA